MVTPVIPDLRKIKQADNPYSALFDYDSLAKEEEARKQQAQASQQKIMRTNAIGDALRTIIEGATGAAGASIAPRAVNPGIMQASQRFNALEDQSRENMERLRLQDLTMKKAAIDYKLGREAEASRQTWEAGQTKEQNRFTAEQRALDNQARLAQIQEQNKGDIERTRVAGQYDVQREMERGENRVREVQARASSDFKKAGGLYVSRYDDPLQVEPVSKEAVISQFDEIRNALKAKGVYPGSFNYPKVLEQQNKGTISESDLQKIVQQFPEVYGKIYPQLYGPNYQQPQQRTYNTPLLPGYVPQAGRKIPYNGPLKPTGTAQAQNKPVAQPTELAKGIFPDAQIIYSNGESAEQVANDLKALVNSKYQDATPAEKAAIYNDLIQRF